MKKELSSLLSLVCVFSLGVAGMACGADALAEGFADPPAESLPRTWWHWMDNNISRAGITKDLEAMGPTSKIRSDLILEVFRKLTANLDHGWLDVVELRRLRRVGGFPVEGKSSSFVGHLNGSTS